VSHRPLRLATVSEFAPRPADIARASRAFGEIVACHPNLDPSAALAHFDSLTGPNWALEWNLPRWLGQAYGLAKTAQADLVLVSALGLTALRLQDDMADGDLPLSAAHHHLAQACLVGSRAILGWLVEGDHPFWGELEATLTVWQDEQARGGFHLADRALGDTTQMAAAGAPLLLTAHAVTAIVGNNELLPAMRACLAAYLSAAVRIDQFKDWQADVAAERYNLFVDHMLEIWVSVPARHRPALVWSAIVHSRRFNEYLESIASQLAAAVQLAGSLSCPGLAAYLDAYRRQAMANARLIRTTSSATFASLQSRLFGPDGPIIR